MLTIEYLLLNKTALVVLYQRVQYIMSETDMKRKNKKTKVKFQVLPARETKQQEFVNLDWKVSESLRNNR